MGYVSLQEGNTLKQQVSQSSSWGGFHCNSSASLTSMLDHGGGTVWRFRRFRANAVGTVGRCHGDSVSEIIWGPIKLQPKTCQTKQQ